MAETVKYKLGSGAGGQGQEPGNTNTLKKSCISVKKLYVKVVESSTGKAFENWCKG